VEELPNRLPVFEAVEEWHKSRSDNRPAEDLLGGLIQAFWAGGLQLYQPGAETTTSREIFLRGLQEIAQDSGIVFADRAAPENAGDAAGGEFVYVDETCVICPTDPAGWDSEILLRAYAILAEAPVPHYPPQFLSAFRTHEIDREEFGWLCDRRGWERPSFWFRPGERKRPDPPNIASGRGLPRRSAIPRIGQKPPTFARQSGNSTSPSTSSTWSGRRWRRSPGGARAGRGNHHEG
jgi:hypothetical protein